MTKEAIRKRLNGIWRCMKYRCHSESPRNPYARYYRDKGIVVCDEWRSDFKVFEKWAHENGYKEGLSIDRIDSDGNYEPENCRWVTVSENSKKANRGRISLSHRKILVREGFLSAREQEILEKVTKAIPEMSEFDKGYMLGKVEEMARAKEEKERAKEPEETPAA